MAADSLYGSTDCSQWRVALGCYGDVVQLLAAEKGKGKKRKPKTSGEKQAETEGLIELDSW